MTRVCPKCGANSIKVRYQRETPPALYSEHLFCRCACGYFWREPCRDNWVAYSVVSQSFTMPNLDSFTLT